MWLLYRQASTNIKSYKVYKKLVPRIVKTFTKPKKNIYFFFFKAEEGNRNGPGSGVQKCSVPNLIFP